ncbi:MAG: glycosyltransferase family 9 protein [Candidatus Omnitrophica bacterium]|nr:glycosyltransferase family 9 protein [Candidatus Omnitrophota bacterium]MDD5238074.1 glycosyltransferase family 9 protein [Candidatus Omnitrophota bacterium]
MQPKYFKNILVINLGGIGDLLLSTPALCALKNNYSQARITLLVIPRAAELARELSYVDQTYIFKPCFGLDALWGDLKTLLVLRKKEFDLAINMRTLVSKISALKINILLGIINPEVKAGRDTEGRGRFFDIKIPETDKGDKYEMEYDIDTVRALGAQEFNRNLAFNIDKSDEEKISSILKRESINESDILIGVNPGGTPSRRWPVENFSNAIAHISKETRCKFILTGTGNESSLAKRIIELLNNDTNIIDVTGQLSIKELGALIKRCNCFISNDTGPMHIAAILKTPLVAIFGPGYLSRFDPRNISERVVLLYKETECAPCNKKTCWSMKCLKAISPDETVKAVLGLLKRYSLPAGEADIK